METYRIILPQFEGPFDLLLFFIERDELDIYNIPVAKITDDFLDYIRHLEALNIDLSGEFILVAATLMRIKARMLLPRKELDEAGNEIDPRQELVDRLLEYKRYKDVLEEIRIMEEQRSQIEPRGNIAAELKHLASQALADAEMESVTVFKLFRTFEKLMQEFQYREKQKVHTIVTYKYTIESQREFITDSIRRLGKMTFRSIFDACETRIHAIVTFLALLELIQMQNLAVEIGEGVNNFEIRESTPEELAAQEIQDTE